MFLNKTGIFIVGLSTLLAAAPLQADVTISQKISITGGGAMSMMSSDGTVVNTIAGDKARMESRVEPRSSMMKRMMPNTQTANIVLVDEEKMIQLNLDKQTWSETTFAQYQAQMEKMKAQMQNTQGGGLPVSEEECEWSPPEISADKTGEKARFAGIKAEQHLIKAQQTCTVPESGKTCEIAWTIDYWNARRMPGDDEAKDFNRAMAEALGSDELMAMASAQSAGLMAMFRNGWEEVLGEFEDIKGYPVKTVMSLSMGGERCTTQSGQPIAMDDVWSDATDAAIDAMGQQAASQAGSAVGRQAGEAVGGSVGGAIAGSAIGAASRELASGMFKKFGRKKDTEKEPEPAEQTTGPAGMVTLFTLSTEVTEVDKGRVDAGNFTVPEGWKQVSPSQL